MKSAKDRMDIISAYQQLGSYRAAAEHCGTTHRTVKKVVDKFEADFKLEVNSVLYGSSCLYMMWNPRHAARLGKKLSELVVEVAKVDLAGKTRIDLIVGCDDEDEEAVEVPTVTVEL